MAGRDSEEVEEYETSVRLGLKKWDLFLNLGLAYLAQHQLKRAAEALQRAESLGPEHPETHFNLALVYEKENRLGDALREIAAVQRLAPRDPDITNVNAIICVENGDPDCARGLWTYMVQVAPDYQPAAANLSILNRSLTRNGKFNSPIELSYDAERKIDHLTTNR